MMNASTIQILLVEDDTVDAEAVQRAFRRHRIANPIHVAKNGREALDRLRGLDGRPALARPYMILLDLNMPLMSGLEFLHELRADPDLHRSVVFVLTTSDAARDIDQAYGHHVAGYLVKERVGEDFVHLVDMLGQYWRYVELPS